MIDIQLGERVVSIAPYKIGDLRRAAPCIDRLNALAKTLGKTPSLEKMTALLSDTVGVLAVGLVRVDPTLTAQVLEDDYFGFDDLDYLRVVYGELMAASGFRSGEATTPPVLAELPEGVLPTSSDASSMSLSPLV